MLAYPWMPHNTLFLSDLVTLDKVLTKDFMRQEDAIESRRQVTEAFIDTTLVAQINDVMHLAVQTAMANNTDIDIDTHSLARQRIPTGINTNDTLRFLIAFLYEKEIGFSEAEDTSIITHRVGETYPYTYGFESRMIEPIIEKWNRRAAKITELMRGAQEAIGNLAGNADFIRDAALVALEENIGLKMTAAGNRITFAIPNDTYGREFHTLNANQSFYIDTLNDVGFPRTKTNQTDTLTVTSIGGANELRFRTSSGTTKEVLAKDASRTFTPAEMAVYITSAPITLPKVVTHIGNQSVEATTTQSLDFSGTFSGLQLTYAVKSSDESKVTARLSVDTGILALTGVAVGTANVTLTATNAAGSSVTSFQVTVTARTEG